ncbi:MAG: twin-arginine translocase TatA/TatE family subunit [Actinomycetota bacterium]|jgi:sec-independent protein translocase protein TatA
MPGPTEWILIGFVVLVLFGAKKIPEMARALGRSSSEFKKGVREGTVDPDDPAPNHAQPTE